MKEIFSFVVVLLSLVIICYSANISFNQVEDIKISYDGKTFICDRITCPESTERCIVTKKTIDDDKTQIERWSRCLNSDDQTLLEDRHIEMNPIPNSNVDILVEHGMHGTYYNDTETRKVIDEIEKRLEKVQQELTKQLKELENMFSKF